MNWLLLPFLRSYVKRKTFTSATTATRDLPRGTGSKVLKFFEHSTEDAIL